MEKEIVSCDQCGKVFVDERLCLVEEATRLMFSLPDYVLQELIDKLGDDHEKKKDES